MEGLRFRYEVIEGGAKLLRVYGGGPRMALPPQLDGFPLVEIGEYAFAPEESARKQAPKGEVGLWPEGETGTALCGSALREIQLPEGVRVIGGYAFYNCRALTALELPGTLSQVGSSAFMNCESLSRLRVKTAPDGSSCLMAVAAQSQRSLSVELESPEHTVYLLFPEFYEECWENVPAKIFGSSIQGTGYSYRQCFQNQVLNLLEYDSLFPMARQREDLRALAEIALGRLRAPVSLSDLARERYIQYLQEQGESVADWLASRDDVEGLELLLRVAPLSREALGKALETAGKLGHTQCVSLLMDARHQGSVKEEKNFEL